MRTLGTFILSLLVLCLLSLQARANIVDSEYNWRQDPRYHTYQMGQHYRRSETLDIDLALNYHLKAAKADYAMSQYVVGWVSGFQKDRDPDYEQSLYWMLKVIAPHETPQNPKYAKFKIEAEVALKKLCKWGVVDFPDSHVLSKDPYCWRKRGDKLFYGRDKLGELVGGKKHGVEQDYAKARYYLEKAYESGETRAAINLAKIYEHGLGVEANFEKYQKYVTAAAGLGDSKTHLALAKKAKEEGRISDYIQHLETAAKTKMPSGSIASSTLRRIYFEGKIVETNYEKAFMHSFLSGNVNYRKGDKADLPFFNRDILTLFQDVSTIEMLDDAKVAADEFAQTYKFTKSRQAKINRSYSKAIGDFRYVQKTGGQWYKDRRWFVILILILFSVSLHGYNYLNRDS